MKLNKEDRTVTMGLDQYLRMRRDCNKLNGLEVWGVDNWEGYSDGVNEYQEETEEEIIKWFDNLKSVSSNPTLVKKNKAAFRWE